MLKLISYLLVFLDALTADRFRLALENVTLRQQLSVTKRMTMRPKIEDEDHAFWAFMRMVFKDWKVHLVIVKPETVVRWHREGFARFWAKKSPERRRPGRPSISMKLIHLIRKFSRENATWGAPHIANELVLLGHDIGETTVAKYMPKRPPGERARQSWRAFLRNHMGEAAACDFFTLPSLAFKVLYVFVVLSHDRRRIVHVNVTTNPTAEWTANQIREAFPGGEEPRFLHRDRDSIYGETFERIVRAMGIEQVVSAKKSPPFGARHRQHPARVHRPHHPAERTIPVPRAERVRRLVQREPTAPLARRQRAGAPRGRARWPSGDEARVRPTPPSPTPRRQIPQSFRRAAQTRPARGE